MQPNSTLRVMYLLKLFYEKTDENHPLSTSDIVSQLREEYGIKTQRTRVSQDIALIEQYVMGHSKPDITLNVYTHADYDYVEHAFRKALNG